MRPAHYLRPIQLGQSNNRFPLESLILVMQQRGALKLYQASEDVSSYTFPPLKRTRNNKDPQLHKKCQLRVLPISSNNPYINNIIYNKTNVNINSHIPTFSSFFTI